MQYYYLNHRNLSVGDIIEPGEWGRTVASTVGHRFLKMEQQFETVRRRINPELPSRFDCIFLFDSQDMAMKFQKLKRPNNKLYEVTLLEEAVPIHVADMMLVHPELEIWDAQWGNPKLYWESANIDSTEIREILTISPVEIISKINIGSRISR